MPEGLEEVGIAGLIIIFIGGVLYWLFYVEPLPFLSEMSGSEIISPIFIIMVGVFIIVAFIIVAIVKK